MWGENEFPPPVFPSHFVFGPESLCSSRFESQKEKESHMKGKAILGRLFSLDLSDDFHNFVQHRGLGGGEQRRCRAGWRPHFPSLCLSKTFVSFLFFFSWSWLLPSFFLSFSLSFLGSVLHRSEPPAAGLEASPRSSIVAWVCVSGCVGVGVWVPKYGGIHFFERFSWSNRSSCSDRERFKERPSLRDSFEEERPWFRACLDLRFKGENRPKPRNELEKKRRRHKQRERERGES